MHNFINFCFGLALFSLVGCQTKPIVFFENINIGDNLETCLANGTIQYRNNDNEFKLNSDIVNKYFNYSDVQFDGSNIIKKAEMKYHQTKSSDTAEEVYSNMTQYFCQNYTGMITEVMKETEIDSKSDVKYDKVGHKNIWETDKIIITLSSYNIYPDFDYIHRKESESESESGYRPGSTLGSVFDRPLPSWRVHRAKEIEGKWVELEISVK